MSRYAVFSGEGSDHPNVLAVVRRKGQRVLLRLPGGQSLEVTVDELRFTERGEVGVGLVFAVSDGLAFKGEKNKQTR